MLPLPPNVVAHELRPKRFGTILPDAVSSMRLLGGTDRTRQAKQLAAIRRGHWVSDSAPNSAALALKLRIASLPTVFVAK